MDVVALLSAAQEPISPDPLPDFLLRAADQVARDFGLFEGWLNNGPSRGEGGLFQMGLPEGLVGRLTEKEYGPRLAIYLSAGSTRFISSSTQPLTNGTARI